MEWLCPPQAHLQPRPPGREPGGIPGCGRGLEDVHWPRASPLLPPPCSTLLRLRIADEGM